VSSRDTRRGMSLIEVLVAVTILAMIGTLVATGFSQTARNKTRIEEEADRYHVVRLAMERIQREISMAYVSIHQNPNSLLQVMRTTFVGTDRASFDRIDFTSFSHQRLYRDAHESDQNELSYFVTSHPDDSRIRVLARREQNRLDDQPERGGRVEILVEDVREFQLEYLDPETVEWTSTWNATESGTQPNRLPAQVKITLTVPDPHDPDEDATFMTRAWVPITWALNHAAYNP
jgi:general secretion pathway protein J